MSINKIIAAQNTQTNVEELAKTYYFFNYELEEKEAKRHQEWELIISEREYKESNTDFTEVENDIDNDITHYKGVSFRELHEELKLSKHKDQNHKGAYSVSAYAQQYVIEEELKARAKANPWLKLRLPLTLLF